MELLNSGSGASEKFAAADPGPTMWRAAVRDSLATCQTSLADLRSDLQALHDMKVSRHTKLQQTLAQIRSSSSSTPVAQKDAFLDSGRLSAASEIANSDISEAMPSSRVQEEQRTADNSGGESLQQQTLPSQKHQWASGGYRNVPSTRRSAELAALAWKSTHGFDQAE
mmetsp:Transcript_73486/g.175137  ORF Transcript_73486/g.175137 Transcript_73486/m.175137 type:complete len:168 (+) Transcript_73486:187-690(+)